MTMNPATTGAAGVTREIVASGGKSILVDDKDFLLLSNYTWFVSKRGYAFRHSRSAEGKRVCIIMHRSILGIDNGDPRIVDHSNGVKTDNRRGNLRVCTKAQNGYNQKAQRTNTTGFKGVTKHKATGRYMAQITVEGQKKYLGVFDSAKDAHAAYCVAALELHGEFANFGEQNV